MGDESIHWGPTIGARIEKRGVDIEGQGRDWENPAPGRRKKEELGSGR